MPAGGQPPADGAADRAGPDDDVPHRIDSVSALAAPCRMGPRRPALESFPQVPLNLPSSPAVSVVPLTVALEVSLPPALPLPLSADGAAAAASPRRQWEFWRSVVPAQDYGATSGASTGTLYACAPRG
jgi:hypothetical protein